MRMKRSGRVLIALSATLVVGVSAAFAASIPNGDFEKGNLSGWKKKNEGGGDWVIYDAKNRKLPGPPGSQPNAPKPFGKYAVVLEQDGPSTNYLIHSLSVPSDATRLSVKLFWVNRGSPPSPPPGRAPLRASAGYWRFPGDWSSSGSRIQFFQLDLLKSSAAGFTTKKSDILATIFKPKIGSTPARSGGWVSETVDVSRYRGEKIKFRLVEGDNSGFLNVGIDRLEFLSAENPTG